MEPHLTEPADILKVARHGSKTSTTEAFLDAVHPRWAVVSVGFANLFHHPHAQVLDRLSDRGIEVWRTDEHGQVRMLTNGKSWRIEAFHQSAVPAAPRIQTLLRPADPAASAQ
jgi:competence protein ComEC